MMNLKNLTIIVPIAILSFILGGCNKSDSEESGIAESRLNEGKNVLKEEQSIDNDTVYHFYFEEEHGSSMLVPMKIASLSNLVNMNILAETDRTKKRLSESSEVFWSLSGLVNDEEPSFFKGGKATSVYQDPDYVRTYFQEAGFNGEPDLVSLIKAYKGGDRKAADLVERLVLYSAQQVNVIGEISLLAYSPRREMMIIGTHAGKWFRIDYVTFMETVPFAGILFEDYLRTISDGLYSSCANYGAMEIEYLEKQYDAVSEKLKT